MLEQPLDDMVLDHRLQPVDSSAGEVIARALQGDDSVAVEAAGEGGRIVSVQILPLGTIIKVLPNKYYKWLLIRWREGYRPAP